MAQVTTTSAKQELGDLAIFGGQATFSRVRSTSNLVQPDFERFLHYSRTFFDARHYSNAGPLSRRLEQQLTAFHEVEHCVAFSSGFWGLVLAARALALPDRHEVIMPSLTYRRMGDAVALAGLVPHFCEVDENTLAPTAATMSACINNSTALLLAAHPIVNTCDAVSLGELATDAGLPILFDSVESVYETSQGRRVGSFADAELFSMHASKLVNGFEGGYVTTPDRVLAARLRDMRGFGFRVQDRVECLGTNAKLNEVHAAMALASLDDVDAQVAKNRARYRVYSDRLAGVEGARVVPFDEQQRPGYKTVVAELTPAWPLSRAQTLEILHAEGMLARPYYAPALHTKHTSYPTVASDLSMTEMLAERFMLLPCGYQTSEADVASICDLLAFLSAHGAAIGTRTSGASR